MKKTLILASAILLSGCAGIYSRTLDVLNLNCDAGDMKYCTAFYRTHVEFNSRTLTEAKAEFLVRCKEVSIRHNQDQSQCVKQVANVYKP